MSTVKFNNVNKIYENNVQAVFNFNLEVEDKEFIVLVGPSGCGKSTTLRMLAGLEEISSGTISIDDEVINNVLPKNRNIAMVFQNYALYPHMTVYDNMAFALKIRHVDKKEIEERVQEAANILGLDHYLKRKPKALSGGQRQRVALGRAIVRTPKVFLMDEPLSNLDAKLRVQMRSEISKIHKRVGATTIYVTHDQTEAMTMASRIVVMKDGFIQQIGTPKEVYNFPNNTFVASFIGAPATNLLKCRIEKHDLYILNEDPEGKPLKFEIEEKRVQEIKNFYITKKAEFQKKFYELDDAFVARKELLEKIKNSTDEKEKNKLKTELDNLELNNPAWVNAKEAVDYLSKVDFNKSVDIIMGIRPEDIYFEKDTSVKSCTTPIKVESDLSELLGHELIVYSYINGQRIIMKTSAKYDVGSNTKISIKFDTNKIHYFDSVTTERIYKQ